MDLVLNNLQRLICHKTQPSKNLIEWITLPAGALEYTLIAPLQIR